MTVRILIGDCRERLKELPDASVHCCVTSPPYFGLRDYGMDGQMGLEPTPDEFVAGMVSVFQEVRRVLRDDGTLWLNIGDTYAGGGNGGGGAYAAERANWRVVPERKGQRAAVQGCKAKDLVGIPWMLAFALRADGWFLRQDIIWSKPNPMPESVRDRCTKAHEYMFLLSKGPRYYFNADAIAEPAKYPGDERHLRTDKTIENARPDGGSRARTAKPTGDTINKRSVWHIGTQPFPDAHFATYPPALVEPCILAGCPDSGTVIDPFGGAGTTGLVADRLQRNAVLVEINPEYAEIARKRLSSDGGMFSEVLAA
jgi:DNA modification methylase